MKVYTYEGIEYTTLDDLRTTMSDVSFPLNPPNEVLEWLGVAISEVPDLPGQSPLELAQKAKRDELKSVVNNAVENLTAKYSTLQVSTFSRQVEEATKIKNGEELPQDALLPILASVTKEDLTTYASRVLHHAQSYEEATLNILMKERSYSSLIDTTTTVEEVDSILIEL